MGPNVSRFRTAATSSLARAAPSTGVIKSSAFCLDLLHIGFLNLTAAAFLNKIGNRQIEPFNALFDYIRFPMPPTNIKKSINRFFRKQMWLQRRIDCVRSSLAYAPNKQGVISGAFKSPSNSPLSATWQQDNLPISHCPLRQKQFGAGLELQPMRIVLGVLTGVLGMLAGWFGLALAIVALGGPDRDGGSPALAALADPHREHGRRSPWSAGLGRGRSAHQARRS